MELKLLCVVLAIAAAYWNLQLARKYRYSYTGKIVVIILAVLFNLLSTLVLWLIGNSQKKSSPKKKSAGKKKIKSTRKKRK